MDWHWIALAIWYPTLGWVVLWNVRARPVWRLLDEYPLPMRVRMMTPFTRSWRDELRPEHEATVLPFRRQFLFHCYALTLLPPLLLFGWLFGTTWLRYERSEARRAVLLEQLEGMEEENARKWGEMQRERAAPEPPTR